MSVDTDIIIIGAGMSGVGMAIQLVRKFGTRNFEIIEKTSDIGGTWFSAEYEPQTATWKVIIEDQRKFLIQKRCKILISAVGALSIPKQCDIPGAESFKGHLFHSAKWDHSFDYKNKEVICIGIDTS
ncbi:hypothetical protein N7510_001991 [Penicillium lagena]|uniref:uncharacterized protein n=1 Tax=Penicillium lagena TaxID=94218 RepID=UPI002541A8C5|nr:uncharacterized protein N7510_001991 [Penicillium lagena]KAJ5625682.1 hypothetical protein N7510_001991 [Penicillium lagena]